VQQTGTSTIVQYVREGDMVTAYYVQRSWHAGRFGETARWRANIAQMYRDREVEVPGLPPGPLTYGRADLLAAGAVKPACCTFDHLPFLSLLP
jgi:hypothetical protein